MFSIGVYYKALPDIIIILIIKCILKVLTVLQNNLLKHTFLPSNAGIIINFFGPFIYLPLERGKGREKERDRNIDVGEKHPSVASRMPPPGDLAHNLGMCPDWELNQQPFGLQASAQSTEPHQPGLIFFNKQVRGHQGLLPQARFMDCVYSRHFLMTLFTQTRGQ